MTTLRHYIRRSQAAALRAGLKGEEGDFFREKIAELEARIQAMPITYQTDRQDDQAIAYLHYFSAGANWYISELDSDPDGAGQVQAFGLADLYGDGGDWGYISIAELVENGVELDLHWKPKPLADIGKKKKVRR